MGNPEISIPGIGSFVKGKFLLIKDKEKREYQGFLQSCGEFLSLWYEDYVHCIRVSEIVYLGTPHKVDKNELSEAQTIKPDQNGSAPSSVSDKVLENEGVGSL